MNEDNKKNILKQCIAEFFGIGLIIFCSTSILAATQLQQYFLNPWDMSCICGLGVSISIYFSSSISGAHLNPALTIFLWLSSQFDKNKVLPYIIAQISGAFFFTIIVYFLYHNLLISFEQKNQIIRGTQKSLEIASIFCSYPKNNMHFLYNLIIEIINTSIFMIILMALNDKKNILLIRSGLTPLLIGILIAIMTVSIKPVNNIILNPAADLGPRIFLSFMGWGTLAFTGGMNIPYFFIPILGPTIGANIGGWTYNKILKNILS